MTETELPTDYRLNPSFAARFVGLALVATALLMFVGTALVALLDLPADLLVILLALSVGGVVALGWWLRSRAFVLHCGPQGYRVGLVRGAGTKEARWTEVAEAVTASPRGIPCVVLKLRDGRTTTIPVEALAVDREQFVRQLQRHLRRGQGTRPLR
ncbi:hypothetical protein [Nocardioides dongkuii]|uniref:hypothetical protein n=1 Tax=Nocardioides dongkuii TaxID=2760089 RepID=UPI001FCFF7C4|nr:hypothetical protein [Nocardioides dongkuii]